MPEDNIIRSAITGAPRGNIDSDGYLTSAITGRKVAKLPTSGKSASGVSVTDAGGYFTGTDVETVLQEVGAGLAGLETALSEI